MISYHDFERLAECAPSRGAFTAQPLSAEEIDALPNADRVWATVLAAREFHGEMMERCGFVPAYDGRY